MYSSVEAIKQVDNERDNSLFLSAGIQENVKLSKVRVDKSINNNSFIEFTFEKDGATFINTEWEPRKIANQTDTAFQDRQNRQLSRILQILKCYYSEDKLNINVSTFSELCSWISDLLNNVIDGTVENVPVRIKIVYNKRGYKQFPNSSKYTFIEPMSVNPSTIEKKDFDIFERPIVEDKEEKVNEDIKTETTDGTKASELPF
jgi:hypothetical protein